MMLEFAEKKSFYPRLSSRGIVELFSKNSNLFDHNTYCYRQTDSRQTTKTAIPRSA